MSMDDPDLGTGPQRGPQVDRPLTALLADLANETTALVRKEVELAKAEVQEKVTEAGRGLVSLALGGGVAFLGLMFLLWAVVYGLSTVMPQWAAALIVGVVMAVIGLILIQSGRKTLSATSLQPKRTIETVKDDARWAKAQISQ